MNSHNLCLLTQIQAWWKSCSVHLQQQIQAEITPLLCLIFHSFLLPAIHAQQRARYISLIEQYRSIKDEKSFLD